MVVSFNPKYRIGDKVYSALDSELTYIVVSILIMSIDENGDIKHLSYGCSDGTGKVEYFRDYELKLLESIQKEN